MKRKAIRRLNNTSNHIKRTNKKIRKAKSSTLTQQEGWDKSKTSKDNMTNLGVYTDINKRVSSMVEKNKMIQDKKEGKLDPKVGQHIKIDEEVNLSDIKSILEKNKLPDEKYAKAKLGRITLDEEWAIEKIYAKHKTNYQKAYIDHKVNTFMWTAEQMERKYNAYIEKHSVCPKQSQ